MLYHQQRLNPERVLALAITGLIVLIAASSWPLFTISMQGITASVTLWGAIDACWQQHAQLVSVLLAFTLFIAPLLQLCVLSWLCGFACCGVQAPAMGPLSRLLHHLHPWSMIEVWLLGVFVAIVKLHSMFSVHWNSGLWSFAVLMLLVTWLASWDVGELWDSVPRSRV